MTMFKRPLTMHDTGVEENSVLTEGKEEACSVWSSVSMPFFGAVFSDSRPLRGALPMAGTIMLSGTACRLYVNGKKAIEAVGEWDSRTSSSGSSSGKFHRSAPV